MEIHDYILKELVTDTGGCPKGTSGGYSFYWAVPIGRNAKELYSTVKKRV